MMRARQLAVLLLLVPRVAAQVSPVARPEVRGINVTVQQETEIRIELGTTAPVPDAQVAATYHDSLILDLPGAVYHGVPRRLRVNKAGVRAVRLWMQTEDPPLTRVVVEIDRTQQYFLSSDGKMIVLRVGPLLQGASSTATPNTSEVVGSVNPGPSPAGRATGLGNAANALAGIFKRGPAKPAVFGSSKFPDAQPMPPGSATQTSQSQNQTQNAAPQTSSSAVASAAQAAKQNSFPTSSVEATKPSDTASASNPPPEQLAKAQPPSAAEAQPDSPPVASPVPPAEPRAAGPKPEEDTHSTPAATPATEAESAATPPPATMAGGTPISAPDMAALAVANPGMRTEFQVKYVDQDAAYLDGGRSSGLTVGMKLTVKNKKRLAGTNAKASLDENVAELVVVGLAETSAVTEIHTPKRDVVPGDLAYLSSEDLQALVQQHASGTTRQYPAVITFSEGGDALDEEAHAFVPQPPLPSVNRASGRIGFDYSGTKSLDSSQAASSSFGAVLRADLTRIGGTYWNFRGYWRGRLSSTSSASSPQTLQDLINRTYHLALTYENPTSRWVLGAGRLYLPWATSLETLDGGYFGIRAGHGVTTGIFGGSTPDPTSWNYNPNRHLGGGFLSAEGGSYDGVRYSSTAGFGKSFETVSYSTTTSTGTTTATYQNNRPFAFFENSVSYKRIFSIFSALQGDQPSANPAAASPGAGISRSFLTVRLQPFSRIEFSANHTYFRDVPTFDPQLVGTGLLDKYLFQGFSGGVRIEVIKNIVVYTDLGRSSRTSDAKSSLNEMYGLTFLRIPKAGIRADVHYSRFISSFGSGAYRAFSISRNLGESFHMEVLGGDQTFTSSLAGNQNAKFLTTNMDTSLGALFFLQGGFTVYRGQLQNYNQWNLTLGYRFDNKWKRK
jgi:AMIN domain-containing protein